MIKQNWNESWKVWKDKNAFALVFAVPEDAITVDVPYDAVFHTQQDPNCVNAGSVGFLNGGVFNYYKEYNLQPEDVGKTILLELEGVSTKSFVYVNSSMVGSCGYSYTDYFVNITDYLNVGMNQILVVADVLDRSSRYYVGGGIYRDVYLLVGGDIYVEPETLHFTTKDIDAECAIIEVEVSLRNAKVTPCDVQVYFEVVDADGNKCVSECYPVLLHGSKTTHIRKLFYVNEPKLWSDENPNLYNCTVSVKQGEKELDSDSIVTGIRKLTIDAMHGLRVNGRTVKLRGACIHHDQGILGAATYYDYEYRRIKKLKEGGFNAVRSAHNPVSKALLTACDMLGMYVMDEGFDMWEKMKNYSDFAIFFEKEWEDVVRAMVRVDYNHPSVVFYSSGNEISEIGTEKGYALNRKICELFHKLDPNRFTTNGINGAFAAGNGLVEIAADLTGKNPSEFADGDINKFMGLVATAMDKIVQHKVVGDILERIDPTNDVMGYNYMTSRYLMDNKSYPNRVIVGTETYPKQIAESWSIIKSCPAIIGDFTWTGHDYMGEAGGPKSFPRIINSSGDISVVGARRPMSYYREHVFGLSEKPYLCVRPPEVFGQSRQFGPWRFTDGIHTWSFPGAEGKPVTVEVFSAGDKVELFLDDKSIGKKANGLEEGCYTAFDTTYQPGALKAISYRNGKVIGEDILYTSAGPEKIYVDAEDYRFVPNSNDLVFINIAIQDCNGYTVENAKCELNIQIDGNAKLLAFGSLEAIHDCGFEKPVTIASEGRALAVLQISEASDSVSVTITSEGLKPASCRI